MVSNLCLHRILLWYYETFFQVINFRFLSWVPIRINESRIDASGALIRLFNGLVERQSCTIAPLLTRFDIFRVNFIIKIIKLIFCKNARSSQSSLPDEFLELEPCNIGGRCGDERKSFISAG